jgi:Family of unknown function (DUF6292)
MPLGADAPLPHSPYIAAVATALGPHCAETSLGYSPGDEPPYALITLAPGPANGPANGSANGADPDGGDDLYLNWSPYAGWSWLRDVTGDAYEWMGLDVLNPLVVPVVATPALVAEAVRLLLLARQDRLPLPGEESTGDAAAVAVLREAVARGDLDPGPADALSAYWSADQ